MEGFLEKVLARKEAGLPLNQRQEEFLAEYERLRNVIIEPGLYKTSQHISVEVISVNEEMQTAVVRTAKSGVEKERTLHWCRKNLVKM